MKKIVLSLFVIFTFAIYIFATKHEDSEQTVVVPPNLSPNPSADSLATPQSSSPATTSTPKPTVASGSKYKDGTFTGDSVDAYYGNVQVQVVIQNGKITDAKFLQYPNDRRTSENINRQAMPYLTQEAIQAQSSNVDIISGATQTSHGFIDSLKTALDKAKA